MTKKQKRASRMVMKNRINRRQKLTKEERARFAYMAAMQKVGAARDAA